MGRSDLVPDTHTWTIKFRGASSSVVKAEIAARLDLWNRGKLEELVSKAKSLNLSPTGRSKSQRRPLASSARLYGARTARGGCQMPPHLLVLD